MRDHFPAPNAEKARAGRLANNAGVEQEHFVDAGTMSLLLCQRVGEQVDRLDVAMLPTQIGRRDDADAALFFCGIGKAERTRVSNNRRFEILRKYVCSRALAARDLNVDDAVCVHAEQIAGAQFGEASHIGRVRRRPKHGTAIREQLNCCSIGAEDEREIVAGVAVDEDAPCFELAIEQRNELRRQPAAMDDVIELLHRPDDLEIAIGRHAQPHVDVAHDERGRQAMPRSVSDCQAEDVVGDRDEVVEVSAHDLGRNSFPPDVEPRVLWHALRQDGLLNALRLDDEGLVAVRAQPLVDGVADEVEREEDVIAAQVRINIEPQDVRVVVPGRDRGETLRAELRLEDRVDARIVRLHDHDAVLEDQLDRLVVPRHRNAERAVFAKAETANQLVAVLVAQLVNASAGDPELVMEVRGDGLPDLLDREARRFRVFDLFERALDLGE